MPAPFRRDDRPEPALDAIWPGYLLEGYFDANGNLHPDLLARKKVEPLVKAMTEARIRLTNNQLRRFFQHCRAIEARLRARASSWDAERATFEKLDISAADAFKGGGNGAKIPRLFHDFIKLNVAAVGSEKDFLHGFLPHFEALVGFGAPHVRDDDRR